MTSSLILLLHSWLDWPSWALEQVRVWLWQSLGHMAGTTSTTAPTGDEEDEVTFPSAFVIFFILFQFHIISFPASFCLSFSLSSHVFSRCNICLFKGRNNHSSSIGRGELGLIILKETWKAEVVTVCWYWIEQWLWHCFIVSVFVLVCANECVCVVSSTVIPCAVSVALDVTAWI